MRDDQVGQLVPFRDSRPEPGGNVSVSGIVTVVKIATISNLGERSVRPRVKI